MLLGSPKFTDEGANVKDKHGNAALHLALKERSAEIAKLLLVSPKFTEQAATAKDREDRTALHLVHDAEVPADLLERLLSNVLLLEAAS